MVEPVRRRSTKARAGKRKSRGPEGPRLMSKRVRQSMLVTTTAARPGSNVATRSANFPVACSGIFSSFTFTTLDFSPRWIVYATEAPTTRSDLLRHEPLSYVARSRPFTATTRSPGLRPARAAGLPAATAATVSSPEAERWSHAPAHTAELAPGAQWL